MVSDKFISDALSGGPKAPQTAPIKETGNLSDDFIEDALGGLEPAKPTLLQTTGAAFQNTATGFVRGLDKAVYGPIVMALEKISPELAKQLSDSVNAPTALNTANPAAPTSFAIGKALGATAPLATGAAAIPAGTGALATATADAALGAASGGTQLPDDNETANRLHDAVMGAAGAFGGSAVTQTGAAVIAKLINRIGIRNFVKSALDSVEGLRPSTSRLLQSINDNYKRISNIVEEKFALRNTAGEEIGPQPIKPIIQAIDEVAAASKKAGVSSRIDPILQKVKDKLSGQEENFAGTPLAGVRLDPSNPLHMLALSKLAKEGQIPIPDQVEPKKIFEALTEVNNALRTTKNAAQKTQLMKLNNALNEQIGVMARQAGKSPEDLLALHQKANQFYKENVVPFRETFPVKGFKDVTGGMSEAQVYDAATKALESNDARAIQRWVKIAGPQGVNDLNQIFMKRALESSVGKNAKFSPHKIVQYFTEHEEALDALPGQSRASIQGFANLLSRTDKLLEVPSIKPWLLTFFGAERLVRGEYKTGTELIASGIGANLALNTFRKLVASERGISLLTAASKLPPNSPKLDLLMERAAHIIGATGGVAATTE